MSQVLYLEMMSVATQSLSLFVFLNNNNKNIL